MQLCIWKAIKINKTQMANTQCILLLSLTDLLVSVFA